MSAFQTMLVADVPAVFLNTDDFGITDAVTVTLTDGTPPFDVDAVLGPIVGDLNWTDVNDETRLLRTHAYIAVADLAAQGMPLPQPTAKFECHGLTGWVLDLATTDWQTELAKIGMIRETLVREWQGRRNASV